ncbi:unnamed protein product [Natator depressus]
MGLRLASLFALWLALSCANEIKKGRTQNHGHYVCSTWGNNHFKTFDGDFYQFPGLCDYNFASDCRESYQEFSVHVQRAVNENGHPEMQYVLITIKDVAIYLTQNTVVVDQEIVTTPYYSSGLLIENNEVYTKVYARAGLVLMWNREDSLMLELDAKFNNNTCGLCGDYNGQQLYNEFLSNDMKFNPITFGNMQKINKPNTVCEDPDETQTVSTCNQHRDECLNLLTSSVFADCEFRLNLEMYVQACMQDKCACQGAEDSFCLCSTISEYSRQCSHAGGRPGSWRTEEFCPKTCPGNMIYQESSSPCISTCSHLEISSLCEEHFMDGCFCPEGTVYDDINGKGCVSVNQCHCKQHGSLYSPGQNITNECEECTCDSGRWVCKQLSCPGSCLVEGGAHITTFDGKKYTFHGDCYYVLSKKSINDTHALLAELSPCGSTDKQTCLKTVVLLIDHKKNILVFRSDGTVLLNELEVHLPHVTASFSIFQPTSYHLIVHTYFGLKLQIQLVPIMQLFVIVDQSAQGKLQGLCGNFNGIECDDFKTAGGLVEATGSAFANTWKAQATCKDQVDNLEDPCALNFESENYAEYWCSFLKNSESPFARCHSAIDPVEYYKRCKYDTCSCKNSEDCLCGALSSYARACAFKGIMLGGWRQTICNKEVSSCPASQVFRYNLTTCQHTCRSLADGEKHCLEGFIPIDGCGCPDNTYMNEKGNCVPISHCTCYYKGSYLEPGDVIVKQEERCVCRNAVLHCTQVKIIDDKCLSPKIHFDCSSVKSWSSQTPLQLSCHTLDTDYFQTECVSGCMCPQGLIDDGRGGCVKEQDCPCIHNKEFYSPGENVKVGCNKCTCQKGRWTCTNHVCYGTCTVYGSGHYISFDGKHYDFDGHCEYVAAQDYCGEDPRGSFSIVTVNVPCGTTGVTCSKAIKLFLGKIELKLEDKQYLEIQREDGDDIQYWTRTVGLYLVIEASNGVMLIWDKKTTIFISLLPYYKGKICGLCGNFDDKSNNDFTTRSGLLVTSSLEFGNSWKQSGSCPDVVDEILPCNLKPHRKSWAEKECSIIQSKVFKDCHAKVDPTPFYDNCVHDACSCDSGGDCECFCSAVAAYAQACNNTGVCVFWRTPDICPIFCDYYNSRNECKWHYEPCGRQIKTCRIINNVSTNFSLPYLEGCYPRCLNDKPIFDEDANTCVTEDECGCYIGNGTRYKPGEEVPTDKPCQKCECNSTGNIMCKPVPGCPSTTTPTTTPITTTTTTTTTPTTTTTTTVPTSTITTETTTVPTTTSSTSTTPCTPMYEYCWWSSWISVSVPEYGEDKGDDETYDKIRAWNASAICEKPRNISCRAQKLPNVPIEDLGQKVQCDVSTGLTCNNKDQVASLIPICYNYEISVYCCSLVCPTTTPTTPTTTESSTPTASTTTESPTTTLTTTTTSTIPTSTTTTKISTSTAMTTSETTPPTTTTTTTETTTSETTTPTTTTTTTVTTTPQTTTPTTTETTTSETTTPTTTTTVTTTPQTTTPTTTTTETTTSETTTPTTTTTTTVTTTPQTTTPTTTTTETTTSETTTPTTTTTVTTTPQTTTPTTTTTETTTSETTTPTTTTTVTTTPQTTTPTTTTTTTTTTETTTSETTTPTTTTTTTVTTTPQTTTPTTTTTTTTTETTTSETTTPTTTTTTTVTTTPQTTTPTTTTTVTTTPQTTTPTTTTTETTTSETTTPTTTTTTTVTTTPQTTTPTTTTTTETTTSETTTPTTTTTTTETTTSETTTPTTTTTTETTTSETTTPTTTTTTTETTTSETTTTTTTTTTATTTPVPIPTTPTITPTTTISTETPTPIPTTTLTTSTAKHPTLTPTPTPTTATTHTTKPSTTTATTMPPSTPCTPMYEYCWWSSWISVSVPEYGEDKGDDETYDKIRAWNASAICEKPRNISCRAQKLPNVPIEDLGQKVQCDVSTGLTCNNKDQVASLIPICYNYEISVYCCSLVCPTTTPTTPTTTESSTPTASTTTESPTTTLTTTTTSTIPTSTTTTKISTSTAMTTSETTPPTTTTTTTETTTSETTTPTTTTTTTVTTTPQTTTPTTTETTTSETTTPTTTTTVTTTPQTTTPTTTTTETTTSETTTPTTTTTTTVTTTPQTTTPTTTTTETTTSETTTPTTTTTVTTTPQTTTPTTTTTETTTSETTTPTTTTTVTTTPQTTTPTTTTTTTTTETTTSETTTPTTTTTTTVTTTPQTTTPTTTTTVTTTPQTTTPTTTTTETTTSETTTSTTTTIVTTTPQTTTPTTTTTETTTSETTTPTTTTTVTTTLQTTTPTTTTTETTTSETTTPTTTTTVTTTPQTTTPTTTETTTSETTTPTTTTTVTTTPQTTTPTTTTTTTTTETTTSETTTPTTTTTTTVTTTPQTTTPTTTTTETTTSETTTPTTTTTTTETTTSETTTPTTTTTTTETTTPQTTTPTTTTTTTETTTSETTTPTTTTTETTTSETTTPTTTTTETTTSETTTPTTTTITATTTPTTTTTTATTTSKTISTTIPYGCVLPNDTIIPPGESYWPCNCTKAICISNDTWHLNTIVCEPPPKPNCTNGLSPVLVQGECCWHWECDCYCTGWGDPHYVTFDGQYYSYQGNCTYVLVEEINKKIDNFGVYIDNYHCDARDRVSCPRTLIVRHETQEVHVKTLRMFPFQIQVTVNNKEVATPYEKYGVRVFKSGINHVVEISRLEVNITYNGLAFSIRLPYKKFGNNTQGQCGTCTNNTADDCMLPDGEIIDNCETMADHWVINDPEKPHCSPSPTKAPPITPPPCKPSDLCKLIKEGPFKACHPFVNPDHFYAACVFDSCAVPNSKLECASLQSYAAVCADQGVCVDWRGHTRDTCPLKCPSHKVYKACGPIEEKTCKSSQVAQNQTSHVEGCFCPDGTIPYGDGVDVCVDSCECCIGPDNEPRKFGERFESDCKNCICLEGGSGIVCEPLKCSEQEDNPSCSDEGFYEVTEVNPANICCNITSCRCNVTFCTTIPPKCKLGYELVSDIPPGKCCPTYGCVPKKVCVLQNAEYLPGSPVFADKCHNCVCTDKSNSSGLNVITCKHIPCIEVCQPGYELKDVKGECCPKCVQTKCVVNKDDNTVLILNPGKMENDPKNNCTVYSCVSIKGQLISSTSEITCPPFNEENCQAGTVTLLPNGCCKTCIPRESPSPCSVTQIWNHITHNGCRSVDKVYLTQCEGSCGTFSIYSAEANSMEHKCSCCREAATSKKQVLLQCPDGKSVMHSYLHVDRCECLGTECTESSSSENSKSNEQSKESEEKSTIERVKRAIQKILK